MIKKLFIKFKIIHKGKVFTKSLSFIFLNLSLKISRNI